MSYSPSPSPSRALVAYRVPASLLWGGSLYTAPLLACRALHLRPSASMGRRLCLVEGLRALHDGAPLALEGLELSAQRTSLDLGAPLKGLVSEAAKAEGRSLGVTAAALMCMGARLILNSEPALEVVP